MSVGRQDSGPAWGLVRMYLNPTSDSQITVLDSQFHLSIAGVDRIVCNVHNIIQLNPFYNVNICHIWAEWT